MERSANDKGVTVPLSSHILEQVERTEAQLMNGSFGPLASIGAAGIERGVTMSIRQGRKEEEGIRIICFYNPRNQTL
jgi:hypothetical protein